MTADVSPMGSALARTDAAGPGGGDYRWGHQSNPPGVRPLHLAEHVIAVLVEKDDSDG